MLFYTLDIYVLLLYYILSFFDFAKELTYPLSYPSFLAFLRLFFFLVFEVEVAKLLLFWVSFKVFLLKLTLDKEGIGLEVAVRLAVTSSEHSMMIGLGKLIFCHIYPRKTDDIRDKIPASPIIYRPRRSPFKWDPGSCLLLIFWTISGILIQLNISKRSPKEPQFKIKIN